MTTPLAPTVESIAAALTSRRYRGPDEYAIHDAITEALNAADLAHSAEHVLSARDRPDFLIGRTVIEVKVQGAPSAVIRQLGRYAAHPDVDAIILATTKRTLAAKMPAAIHGVPIHAVVLPGPAL